MHDTDDQRYVAALIEECNVDRRSTRDRKDNGQEDQSTRQMASVVPGCRDVREFGKCSDNHDETSDGTAQSGHGENHWPCRSCRVLLSVDTGRVPGGVDPENGDVHDPNSVEVDKQMQERSLFEVSLEEGL